MANKFIGIATDDADFAFQHYDFDLRLFYDELELDQSSIKVHTIAY